MASVTRVGWHAGSRQRSARMFAHQRLERGPYRTLQNDARFCARSHHSARSICPTCSNYAPHAVGLHLVWTRAQFRQYIDKVRNGAMVIPKVGIKID